MKKSLVYLERAVIAEARGNVQGAGFCFRMALAFEELELSKLKK